MSYLGTKTNDKKQRNQEKKETKNPNNKVFSYLVINFLFLIHWKTSPSLELTHIDDAAVSDKKNRILEPNSNSRFSCLMFISRSYPKEKQIYHFRLITN